MKKVKIKSIDDLLSEKFKVKVGDTYEIISEGKQEYSSKYGYLIYTKNKSAITVYANEVEVIENKKKKNED